MTAHFVKAQDPNRVPEPLLFLDLMLLFPTSPERSRRWSCSAPSIPTSRHLCREPGQRCRINSLSQKIAGINKIEPSRSKFDRAYAAFR
jgi:hypothetical protein